MQNGLQHFRRLVRYHPVTEKAQAKIRSSSTIHLPEISRTLCVQPGDVVIDCGANIGDLSSRFARTEATIYAFEPQPLCFDILQRRFKFFPHVHCRNQGVMDRDCTLTLSTPLPHAQFDQLGTTVAASFVVPQGYAHSTVDVPCIDLAQFILDLGQIKLLKIDIEGAEVAVLNRLLDTNAISKVELTVVETHERFSPEIEKQTDLLRKRIALCGLSDRVDLNWH